MERARFLAVATLVAFAGCGGGGSDGGTGPTPVFTSLSLAPGSPTVTVGNTTNLTATAKDQSGAAMTGLQTTYSSANTSIATVTNAGVVTGVALGSTDITATGTIGSVTRTAKVTVTVAEAGANASVDATLQNSFDPQTVTIKPNGTVTWTFATLHNVTFDTQGAPGPIGNKSSGQATLTFPNAGTFNYHCTIHGTSTTGMRGTVVVQP